MAEKDSAQLELVKHLLCGEYPDSEKKEYNCKGKKYKGSNKDYVLNFVVCCKQAIIIAFCS